MSSAVAEIYRYQEHVAADIGAVLPLDVRTILDVGCGEGYVLQRLPGSLFLVGADRRREPLRMVRNKRTLGDITRLPFSDKTFDLVMANDVLEHLDREARLGALGEMARIADRYIIVTVPFMEDLNLACTRCSDCGRYYHVNRHGASFGLRELGALLEKFGYQCVLQVLSGDQWQSQPSEVVFLRRLLLLDLATTETPSCPSCGGAKIESGAGTTVLKTILDNLAMLACLRERALGDLGFLRTECICLYAKQDYVARYPDTGFISQQGQSVTLKMECVPINRISFTIPGLYRRQFFPTYSQLPYFICEDIGPEGVRVTVDRPAQVGFFLWKDQGHPVNLIVRGLTHKTATLCIWSYDNYRGYHSPIRTRVSGGFCLDLSVRNAELSRYGLVFELKTEDAPITLQELRLSNVETDEVAVYDNAEGKGRFLRLPGKNAVLVSLPLYGRHIVEATWMRDASLLLNPARNGPPLQCQPDALLSLLHSVVEPLKSECDNLARTLNSLIKEYQLLQTTYERTFGRRLQRSLARIWKMGIPPVGWSKYRERARDATEGGGNAKG